jgi:hypothetical protein
MTKFWLPRLLYFLILLIAAVLILLVILSPWLDNWVDVRVISFFAHDRTLRSTSVASALGLIVTACVFFRPAARTRRPQAKDRRPSPPNIAGA